MRARDRPVVGFGSTRPVKLYRRAAIELASNTLASRELLTPTKKPPGSYASWFAIFPHFLRIRFL